MLIVVLSVIVIFDFILSANTLHDITVSIGLSSKTFEDWCKDKLDGGILGVKYSTAR